MQFTEKEHERLIDCLKKQSPYNLVDTLYWEGYKGPNSILGQYKTYGGPEGSTAVWADFYLNTEGPAPFVEFYHMEYDTGRLILQMAFVDGCWHTINKKEDIPLLKDWYKYGGKRTPEQMELWRSPKRDYVLWTQRGYVRKHDGATFTTEIKRHKSGGVVREKVHYFVEIDECFRRYYDVILYPNGAYDVKESPDCFYSGKIFAIQER